MDSVPQNASSRNRLQRLIRKFRDKDYRDSYVRSHTKQFLARQMRAFRGEQSQKEFAEVLGVSQSVVSERFENPNYGKWSLNTLFDTAANLDVAVFVRFVDFKTFLELSDKLSEKDVRPQEYNQAELDKLITDDDIKSPPSPSSGDGTRINWRVNERGVLEIISTPTEAESASQRDITAA